MEESADRIAPPGRPDAPGRAAQLSDAAPDGGVVVSVRDADRLGPGGGDLAQAARAPGNGGLPALAARRRCAKCAGPTP
ncbi:hypothetical protein ACIRFH_29930 [Streptomyces sp. NPDC093586]|uniref:hypothetical protein n=1 Tax=Streptomyces sp. NPDC093586 TaxID=3366042 RepID=UPI00380EF17B